MMTDVLEMKIETIGSEVEVMESRTEVIKVVTPVYV